MCPCALDESSLSIGRVKFCKLPIDWRFDIVEKHDDDHDESSIAHDAWVDVRATSLLAML